MHSVVHRLSLNTASILASDLVHRLSTFAIYTLIARYLGAYAFGQMSLALTFFQTFQLLALVGLQTLITRDVAKDKSQTSRYFLHGSLIVILFSVLSIVCLMLITRMLNYAPETSSIILLLSLSLLPYALATICDAVFQAWEHMVYIAYTNIPVHVIRIVSTFLLLSQGYHLHAIVLLLLISYTVALVIKWGLILRYLTTCHLTIDFRFACHLTKATSTFLGIHGVHALLTSLTVILLSKLASEVDVALLSASEQVLVPVALVFESLSRSTFPMMCRCFEPSYQEVKGLAEQVLKCSLALVLPATVGLFFLADSVAILLYGNQDFVAAAEVLRIVVWCLVLRVFTQVLGQVLVASAREKTTLRILLVDVGAMALLAPLCIQRFGVLGAAIAILAVRLLDFVQHYLPVARMFSGLAIGRLVWKPLLASAIMALYVLALHDHALLLTIPSAACLYGVTFFLLTLWHSGGLQPLKAKYGALFSK